MAPLSFPEEVDVFTVPHSRMKELVNKYLEMLTETNFDDAFRMTSLLENLSMTFREFKAHEQIENRCIMRKLKQKLRALSITNSAVCNCHKDNQLTEMMRLFRDGYRCTGKTAADRNNYGLKLRRALEQFTEQFIPHMKEEEEVFQPLLMKYFTYEELRELKNIVLQEHWRTVEEDREAKLVEDSQTSESSCDEEESDHKGGYSVFDLLPDELMLKIFSYLNPKQLGSCAKVNKRWNQLMADPKLWANFYPIQWAKGNWTFYPELEEEDTEAEALSLKEQLSAMFDEDADIDESVSSDDSDSEDTSCKQLMAEIKLLSSLTKHLLPKVGKGVKRLNLANSLGLTNGTLYKILLECPDVEVLQLSQTRVSDIGFKVLGRNGCGGKLKSVDLSGCERVTDITLNRLSHAFHVRHVSAKTCKVSGSSAPSAAGKEARLEQDLLEKSQKTLKNEKFTRTEQFTKDLADSNVISPQTSMKSKIVRTKSSHNLFEKYTPAEGESPLWRPQSCSEEANEDPVTDVRNVGLTYSEMTFCACPLARRKFTQNSVWNITTCNIEDCVGLRYQSAYGKNWSKSASGCDIKEAPYSGAQEAECDSLYKTVNSATADWWVADTELKYLNLSGCWAITDAGLRCLAQRGGLPALEYLDLSGCLNITAAGLTELVEACPKLDHANLYYCDNLENDPYRLTATGCQNVGCGSRICCRTGK